MVSSLTRFLEEPRETLEAMLETANLVDLRGHIQSVLVLNSLKLYCKLAAKWFNESTNGCKLESSVLEMGSSEPSQAQLQALLERLLGLTNFLMDKISLFVHSANLEVQERVRAIWCSDFSSLGWFNDFIHLYPGCFNSPALASHDKEVIEVASSGWRFGV